MKAIRQILYSAKKTINNLLWILLMSIKLLHKLSLFYCLHCYFIIFNLTSVYKIPLNYFLFFCNSASKKVDALKEKKKLSFKHGFFRLLN